MNSEDEQNKAVIPRAHYPEIVVAVHLLQDWLEQSQSMHIEPHEIARISALQQRSREYIENV